MYLKDKMTAVQVNNITLAITDINVITFFKSSIL